MNPDVKDFLKRIFNDLYNNGLNPNEASQSVVITEMNRYLDKQQTYKQMINSILNQHPWRIES